MFRRLTEAVLSLIMRMMHKREILSAKATKAQQAFIAGLEVKNRKTKKPVVVAFFGLVGSGKSSVAQELAKHIGGTVIEGDAIRVNLRKIGERYKYVRQIAENAALEVLKRGGNAVFDADFADEKKRASVREKVREAGAWLVYVRTSADPHVMLGRILSAEYRRSPDDFFGGAKTKWEEGTDQQRGAVIKFGEAWRRTPHHYRWVNEGGGKWVLKKPPVPLLADIDTTNPTLWKEEVSKLARKLINL